ncbi:hypothetical protein [Arthrobacter sp. AL12]|uniref:VOC family protein n=1 Tax=Arthrobacter sp. AL12 TaxID=3042241 RepID=UPI00249A1AB4|nr:hypothetical protein [Arthrobacter sp. AL12]MDI3212633.1 hypothetical protein [Arthrobacter sp. AL12]
MLNRFYVNPILPAQDGYRARRFYRDVLGVELLTGETDDPMVFGAANGSSIALSEMPDRVPPPYPVVSFMVTGIEEVLEGLKPGALRSSLPALPASQASKASKASKARPAGT